jgi:hypothetical protein
MVLSDENIIEFQNIYREHFGKEITKEDACNQGMKLLKLVSILYRQKTTEDFENSQAQQVELLRKQN